MRNPVCLGWVVAATIVTGAAGGIGVDDANAAPAGAVTVAAYGTWASPIGADRLAQSGIGVSDLRVAGGRLYWRESRPSEGGRQVLMSATPGGAPGPTVTPPEFNVRTRVQEYGGASYVLIGDSVLFSHYADQRLYRQRAGAAPVALTAPGYRWADCVHDAARDRLICVREDHTPATVQAHGEERNEIVAVPLAGAPTGEATGTVLVTGADFVAYPRVSPDGRRLAWLQWNHPDMPWDATTLHVAELTTDGLANRVEVAGGARRAVLEPSWDADGTLYFIDDPDGWWNLYRWRDGRVAAVAPMAREFGGPLWSLGARSYAPTGDGRAVVRHARDGLDTLGVLDLATGRLTNFELPPVAFADVQLLDRDTAVAIAASRDEEPAIVAVDLRSGTARELYRAVSSGLPQALVSRGEAIEFPTADGPGGERRTAHAFFYPPTNPAYRAPDGEKPPLLVMIHGGPTSAARPTLSLQRQYWTSRGFAVVDVNYGGSTTFGRAYRERLNGGWGVVDVQDAVAAVDHLVATGRVDPRRVAIRGGSAGGFTTLAALAFTDRFRAGANYFGVSDIEALARDSHKFERRYDVSLVGPPSPELYRSRSPIHHLDGFREPLITFQGAEDKVVPPNQSRMIVDALKARGVPVAYLEFEGEQHGFRKAASIVRAQEAELYFYGRVFGFVPAGDLPPVEIHNLAARAGG